MADDLRLGDLGQPRRFGAQKVGRDQLLQGPLRDPGLGDYSGPAAGLRLLEDRHRALPLLGSLGQGHAPTPAAEPDSARTAAPSASARASICSTVRRSVSATSRPFGYSG